MGEAMPPRRVARVSVFHRRCDRSVLLKHHWNRGIDDRVRSLRVIVPGGGVRVAAPACSGPQLRRGTTLEMTVQFAVAYFRLLSLVVAV